jgi:hypothetical protein
MAAVLTFSRPITACVSRAQDGKTEATVSISPVHQTLRVTPAMQAGLADHVWAIEEIVALLF